MLDFLSVVTSSRTIIVVCGWYLDKLIYLKMIQFIQIISLEESKSVALLNSEFWRFCRFYKLASSCITNITSNLLILLA